MFPKTVEYLSGEKSVEVTIWLSGIDSIMGSTQQIGNEWAIPINPTPNQPINH